MNEGCSQFKIKQLHLSLMLLTKSGSPVKQCASTILRRIQNIPVISGVHRRGHIPGSELSTSFKQEDGSLLVIVTVTNITGTCFGLVTLQLIFQLCIAIETDKFLYGQFIVICFGDTGPSSQSGHDMVSVSVRTKQDYRCTLVSRNEGNNGYSTIIVTSEQLVKL